MILSFKQIITILYICETYAVNATRTKSTVPYTAFLQDTLGSSSSGCAQHALQPILQQQKQQPTIGKMTMKSRPTTTDTENPRKFSRTYKRGVDMFTGRATQGSRHVLVTGRATKRVVDMFNWKDNRKGCRHVLLEGQQKGCTFRHFLREGQQKGCRNAL